MCGKRLDRDHDFQQWSIRYNAGMFFSFDGVDGAGKSTQMERFCLWLRQQGHDFVTCRDPGSTQLGERLRSILLEKSTTPIARRAEMLLYMSSRAQLVEEVIRPALEAGKTVVCDRYLLANIVYQGHAGGLDPADIRKVGEVTVGGLMPDLTFVFDVPVELALTRMSRELDRMESQGIEYMHRVRDGFLTEIKTYPARTVVIDARGDMESIQREVIKHAEELLEV
jgi:dTMP kinase